MVYKHACHILLFNFKLESASDDCVVITFSLHGPRSFYLVLLSRQFLICGHLQTFLNKPVLLGFLSASKAVAFH